MTETPAGHAPDVLRRTPLYEFHRAHGGHMVPFNGWEMPLYYTGILDEHRAVRSKVGLFDVSHMGILTVTGETAGALLGRRTTADIAHLAPGVCKYCFWLNADGLILDDLLITRLDDGTHAPPRFLAIPNAGRAGKVFDLIRQHRLPDTEVLLHNPHVAILAVQGPGARELLETRYGWSLGGLKFYTARGFPGRGAGDPAGRMGLELPAGLGPEWLVSRTGYTGETGYEILVPAAQAASVAEELVAAGATPCGLGSRDTLRMEKGYLLSGQDFLLDRTPFEAGQDRFVEMGHEFVGRTVLLPQSEKGAAVRFTGLAVRTEGVVPRHGTPVLAGEETVAVVTSGGISPTLGYGIALAYLPRDRTAVGTKLELGMRGRRVPAAVVALPFLPAPLRRP